LLKPEGAFLGNVRDWRIGRQPQRRAPAIVADVARADGGRRKPGAGVGSWSQANYDTRRAFKWPHQAEEGSRAIDAPVLHEARGEIDHLHGGALAVAKHGAQNGCVAQIGLLGRCEIREVNRPETCACRPTTRGLEQSGKYRFAVWPGMTRPYESAGSVEEGAHRAIADRRQVQIRNGWGRCSHWKLSGDDNIAEQTAAHTAVWKVRSKCHLISGRAVSTDNRARRWKKAAA
jgi:hypothetical protein